MHPAAGNANAESPRTAAHVSANHPIVKILVLIIGAALLATGLLAATGAPAGASPDLQPQSATEYTVTFDSNSGSATGSMAPQTSDVPAALNANQFTRTGYSFANWNTSPTDDGVMYADEADFPFTNDTALYAIWAKNSYVLQYSADGATSGTNPEYVIVGYGNVAVIADQGTLERTGYEFAGWNSQEDGSGETYPVGSEFIMPASDVTLYPLWVPVDYTFSYDGNTNTTGTPPTSATYQYGASVTVADAGSLAKTDFEFAGWNTAADGNGDPYAANASLTMPASNVTLYAQWTAVAPPPPPPPTPTPTPATQSPATNCVVATGGLIGQSRPLTRAGCVTNAAQQIGTKMTFKANRGDMRTAKLKCRADGRLTKPRKASATYGTGFVLCSRGTLVLKRNGTSGSYLIRWTAPAETGFAPFNEKQKLRGR